MKSIFKFILLFSFLFSSVAILEKQARAQEKNQAESSKKILIAYYSNTGNTRALAEKIQKNLGGNLFEIQASQAYPTEYQKLTAQAKKEINENFRPELKANIKSLSQYDIIFIGSPIWWSTIAPIVSTFLTQNDFSQKILIPFVTHGGSGLARSVDEIKKLAPQAKVLSGKAFVGPSVSSSDKEIAEWIKGLKL